MIEGNQVRLTCEFRDFADQLADPDTVTVRVAWTGAAPVALTAIRDAPGVYHALFLPPVAGRYFVRWEGTGGVVASNELAFIVHASHVPSA